MAFPLTVPPKTNHKSFLYSPINTDLDTLDAHIAFLGILHGSPYSMADVNNEQSRGPAAMRQATDRAVRSLERYDFDIGGPALPRQADQGRRLRRRAGQHVRLSGSRHARRAGGAQNFESRRAADDPRRRSRDSDPCASRLRRPRPDHDNPNRRTS